MFTESMKAYMIQRGAPKRHVNEISPKPRSTIDDTVLYGPPGTGKTYAACSAAAGWLIGRKEQVTNGSFRWLNWNKFMFMARGAEHRFDFIQGFVGTLLLVIDDFGSDRRTDFSDDTMLYIVNERYEREWPTIITTNLKPEAFQRIDPRIASRLNTYQTIQVAEKDRRLPKSKK